MVLEKKSLHESAVGDPVQDPEIMPSKKRKIESNMPLTRSKVCFYVVLTVLNCHWMPIYTCRSIEHRMFHSNLT